MINNKITLNVLADISKKMNSGGLYGPDNKLLVLFNGANLDLDSRLNEIEELRQGNIKLALGFSFMGEGIVDRKKIIERLNPSNIYGEEDIFELENIVERNPKLLIPNLTINTLSKVALGMIDSFASTLLWTYLYFGKDVYLDFSSANNYLGKKSQNPAIIKLIDSHISSIKDMGAIEVKEGEYSKKVLAKESLRNRDSNIGFPDKNKSQDKEGKKLLTEKDIEGLKKEETIRLPKGSIITPLAKDRIREKKIQVEIIE